MRIRHRRWLLTVPLLVGMQACSEETQQGVEQSQQTAPERVYRLAQDPVRYTRGLKLYQQNCAACHGKQGEGAPDWKSKDAAGNFRPPPLNGSGHTWHHPMPILMDIINNGTQRLGGNMPAWKATLSEGQIQDILFWVRSQWPPELYSLWYRNNQEYTQSRSDRP